jgi:hypothetical protein
MSDVLIHAHIPIIGKQYDLRMRKEKQCLLDNERKYGLVVRTTGI